MKNSQKIQMQSRTLQRVVRDVVELDPPDKERSYHIYVTHHGVIKVPWGEQKVCRVAFMHLGEEKYSFWAKEGLCIDSSILKWPRSWSIS